MNSFAPGKFEPLKHCLIALAIFLITLMVFRGALDNEFVNWDDQIYVESDMIQNLSLDNFGDWLWSFDRYEYWHPLAWISHALDYNWHRMEAGGHHLTSIALHAFNACLAFFLFILLLKRSGWEIKTHIPLWLVGAIVALLFGLHPLRAESAVWIAERKDVLCGFFVLSTYLAYLAYVSRTSGKGRLLFYFLTLACFILALTSKAMALTVPVVLVILDVFPLNRLRPGRSWKIVIAEKIPFFALSFVVGVVTILHKGTMDAKEPTRISDPAELVFQVIRNASFYLEQTFWPSRLAPFYPRYDSPDFLSGAFLFSSALVLGISAFCLMRWRKGEKIWSAVWIYYLVAIAPILNIHLSGGQIAADRYTYLSTLSFYFLFGAFIVWLGGHSSKTAVAAAMGSCLALIGILGSMTLDQVKVWRHGGALWGEVLRIYPNVLKAHINLAEYYSERGEPDKAENQLKTAIRLHPEKADNHIKLGLAYNGQNRLDLAEEQFKTSIEKDPAYAPGHLNLGMVYARRGQLTESEQAFRAALELEPDNLAANLNLGLILIKLNRLDEAERSYLKALAADPDNSAAYLNLGGIYRLQERLEEAAEQYRTVIRIEPENISGHMNLGIVYLDMGRLSEAEEHFNEALRIKPDQEKAKNYLDRVRGR